MMGSVGHWFKNTRLFQTASLSRSLFKVNHSRNGFTIVEVIIFIAVTSAMLFMVSGTMNKSQRGAEFNTAVRELESQLRKNVSDISNGYFNNTGGFTCSRASDGAGYKAEITAGANEQGTNEDCVFLGYAYQYGEGASHTALSGNKSNLFTIVGLRLNDSGEDPEDLAQSKPTTVDNLDESVFIPPGLEWKFIKDSLGTKYDGFALASTLNDDETKSRKLNMNLYPIAGAGFKGSIPSSLTAANAKDKLSMCFQGTGVKMYAVINITPSGVVEDPKIESGDCPA